MIAIPRMAMIAIMTAMALTIGILASCDSTQKRNLENDLNENPDAYRKKWGIKDD